MATTKISQLPAASGVVATDILPMVDDPSGTPVTQKVTATLLRDYILAISGGIATISENLAAATDGVGSPGGALSWRRGTKSVTAIPANTATAILTVTVPNADHYGCLRLMACAEDTGTEGIMSTAIVMVKRDSGSNTLKGFTEVADSGTVAPPQYTFTWSTSGLTGASSATQTFTVNAQLDIAGGSADFTLKLAYEVLNANASGITVA